MRILSLHRAGGREAAFLDIAPLPQPGPGEVRIALKAASLNHRELWICRGMYPGMTLPATLGCDGAGMIDAVGDGVDAGRIGEAVILYPGLNWGPDDRYPGPGFGLLGMPGPGTIADAICLPADNAVPKPRHLDFAAAAAVPLAALTAWRGLVTKGGLRAGDRLLVTGIGGGVATFALKFGVAMGAEVFVTSGSEATLAAATALGARGAINYRQDKWGKALARASGGIDLVFDAAPAGGYAQYGRALDMGARVVVYGSTGGQQFEISAPELFLKNIQLIGTNVGNLAEFRAMIAFIEEKRIEPAIETRFDIDDVKAALEHLEESHGFGKIVIDIGD